MMKWLFPLLLLLPFHAHANTLIWLDNFDGYSSGTNGGVPCSNVLNTTDPPWTSDIPTRISTVQAASPPNSLDVGCSGNHQDATRPLGSQVAAGETIYKVFVSAATGGPIRISGTVGTSESNAQWTISCQDVSAPNCKVQISVTSIFTFNISTNAWHVIDLKWFIDPVMGTMSLMVDGSAVGSPYTGNTAPSGSGTTNYVDTCLVYGGDDGFNNGGFVDDLAWYITTPPGFGRLVDD